MSESILAFDQEEQVASDHLIAFMQQVQDWDLNCNQQELVTAIHTLQTFVIKHMIQRLNGENFSEWYG